MADDIGIKMGEWGYKNIVNQNTHISIVKNDPSVYNPIAKNGFHITTAVHGTGHGYKAHDYFDNHGNYKQNKF